MFDPDLFISWMADQGTGSLSTLIRDASWASGCDRKAVTQWLSRIEVLGAATLDWRGGRWHANPCQVTDLPGNTQTAVLTGARPVGLGFYTGRGAVTTPQQHEQNGIPLPGALWFQYPELSRLHEFAAAVSAEVVPCAAESASRSLRAFDPGPESAPPACDSQAELLDPLTGRFRPVGPIGRRPAPGLYKYKQFGHRDRYVLLREPSRQPAPGHRTRVPRPEPTWHSVDRRAGIHYALRPSALPLRWKADQVPGQAGRNTLGRLTADRMAPLPLAQERTAVLCTGLTSLRTAESEHYDGVPLFIAERIAHTLHRRLETA
ncbi:hypothetical protein ABZW02_26550 [Streptomyces sp. NPDC005180]|uniref:hypothetical protein n=1 Tax=Streptomyces sp. NPDC005180 TaxID=3156868 RepID=UPI0033BD5AA2